MEAVSEIGPLEIATSEDQLKLSESTHFEGASAGFDGMLKQTTLRSDLGNMSKSLLAISMDEKIPDVDMGIPEQPDKPTSTATKPKRKRRKLNVDKKKKLEEVPLPKGLDDDDDGSKGVECSRMCLGFSLNSSDIGVNFAVSGC